MYHRLQIFYGIVALLAAAALAGMVALHYFPNWVKFPEENGEPSYGVWKACAYFPNQEEKPCRRWWNERWQEEAELVHTPVRAVASFAIFGMFFNLILFIFVSFVAIYAAKVDFYPGVPVTLSLITGIMYFIMCMVMEFVVKWRLVRYSDNHSNLPRNAPREIGPAAIGAWIALACTVVNFFIGVLILVFKPTREEVQKQFEKEHFNLSVMA